MKGLQLITCLIALSLILAGRSYGQSNSMNTLWPNLPKISSVPLGVNLEGMADWMRCPMYVDAMKTSRPFGEPDKPWVDSGKMLVDSNGWPLEDAGTVVITDLPHMAGTYHFSCIGKTTVLSVASDAVVTDEVYDTKSNTTTADIVVNPTATQLMLSFTHTDGGIKNIKLIRPGYSKGSLQLFTTDFLNAIKPFAVIRFMDFSSTNGNTATSWTSRCKPSAAQYTLGKGGPWEDAIALANATGKDMWVNIPEEADDDYIRQMALLFKKTLLPERVVYLENSNEVWNWSFQQATANKNAAELEGSSPNSTLRIDTGVQWDDPNNKYYWAVKRVAERLIKISEIWQSVYGKAALNSKIRPVLASQVVNTFLINLQIGYIAKVVGPPKNYIYAIAGAPYFGLNDATVKNSSLTVDDVIADLGKAVDDDNEKIIPPVVAIANKYGVKCFAYEGGPDVGQSTASLDAKIAANRDAKMSDLLSRYLGGWYVDGGSLFMYFDLSGAYGQWGCWGLTDDITRATPKTEAIAKILSEPAVEH